MLSKASVKITVGDIYCTFFMPRFSHSATEGSQIGLPLVNPHYFQSLLLLYVSRNGYREDLLYDFLKEENEATVLCICLLEMGAIFVLLLHQRVLPQSP